MNHYAKTLYRIAAMIENSAHNTKTASRDVAMTILKQMGGWRRISAMTGAKQVIIEKDGMGGASFKFSNNARGMPNHVKIILEADDTYTVTFSRVRGMSFKKLKELEGIYASQLKGIFERTTGLYLSL